jgi:hypothetical protein
VALLFEYRYKEVNIGLFMRIVRRSVHVPHVNANIPTPTKLEHAVISQSIVKHDGSYVVPATIAIDGSIMTPAPTIK